jgi:hypothetical protein
MCIACDYTNLCRGGSEDPEPAAAPLSPIWNQPVRMCPHKQVGSARRVLKAMQAIEAAVPQSALTLGSAVGGMGGNQDRGGLGGSDGPDAQAALLRTRVEAAEQVDGSTARACVCVSLWSQWFRGRVCRL